MGRQGATFRVQSLRAYQDPKHMISQPARWICWCNLSNKEGPVSSVISGHSIVLFEACQIWRCFHSMDPFIDFPLYTIHFWVHFITSLTVTEPWNHGKNKGNHLLLWPNDSEQFRLVKYYNLPRSIFGYPHLWKPPYNQVLQSHISGQN
jgi:hypothetical protein